MHRFARIAAGAVVLSCASTAIGQTAPRPPMIPAAVVLQNPTPNEEKAHTIWSLRAALNVAALQCQFSPFLATVGNYNNMLRHHSEELNRARLSLAEHFKHQNKNGSQKIFDQYTTRTYNSFSTLDAQTGFCEKASVVGRQALMTPKGVFATFAAQRLPEIRASLIPQIDTLKIVDTSWIRMPHYENSCLDKKGRPKKRC